MNNRRERGEKTTWFQREAILQWLEVEINFKLMTGEAAHGMKMVVAGARVTKATAYQELAVYVNQKCSTHWDGKAAESRFRAYKKLYIDTKKKLEDPSGPKFCLSDADIAKGCNTIEKKLDQECPGFARMDILFGNKQNVKPHSTMQSGLNLLLQATALGKEALEWKIQYEKELLVSNKENHYDELRIKQQEVDIKAKAVVEQTKRELTLKLIDQGKTPTQIQEYLEAFGYI